MAARLKSFMTWTILVPLVGSPLAAWAAYSLWLDRNWTSSLIAALFSLWLLKDLVQAIRSSDQVDDSSDDRLDLDYQEKADECRALADESRNAEHRATLTQMAQTFDRLAAQVKT
jgi:hypothetical protein